MKVGTVVFELLLVIAPALQAQVVANCEEPTGSRYDMIGGLVKSQPDGFEGAHPVLVLSANPDSTILGYSWGPAKWAADAGLPTTVEQAVIVSRMPEKITAVVALNDPAGVVQMISLFPGKGLVLMSQHKYMQVGDGVPNAGTFYARCTVGSR